jgi:hypothetical protein
MQVEAHVNESNELDIIDIDKIDECITLNNCHIVVKYWRTKNPKLIEAIVNEYEAQIRFGEKDD